MLVTLGTRLNLCTYTFHTLLKASFSSDVSPQVVGVNKFPYRAPNKMPSTEGFFYSDKVIERELAKVYNQFVAWPL